MPVNQIKHDVKEGKGTKKSLEKKWDKAKDAAGQGKGTKDKWALTNYIYQKMRDSKKHASLLARAIYRLNSTYEDGEIKEASPFEDWLHTLHFSFDRPDEHADYAIMEASPHEVTLHLQNEGWAFRGDPETPPYKFSKDGKEIELHPVDDNRTKLALLDENEQ